MTYLQRINYRPTMANMNKTDERFLTNHFDAYGEEMVMSGEPIRWDIIEEVEVVVAPRASGAAGWIVKRFFLNNEVRYHVGVYFGHREAVMPNITWDVAKYIVESIAYYAPKRVRYSGPDNLVPITEI